MSEGLIEVTERLKKEYEDRLSKVVGFGAKISELKCSFCGKTSNEVNRLISGDRVYICDECVSICNEIISQDM